MASASPLVASQGAQPALFVGCSRDWAKANASDPVERESSLVTCVAAFRCQPTFDPQRMQEWVPGVKWGAPAFGVSFEESLKRRDELLPVMMKWSPDYLLHKGTAPVFFENEWGQAEPLTSRKRTTTCTARAGRSAFKRSLSPLARSAM